MILEKEKVRKILDFYGHNLQKIQAVEEMAELSVELIKNANRNKSNEEAIKDEIADVSLMLYQLKMIYNITDEEIDEVIDRKIDRQLERIEAPNENKR